MPQDPKKPKDPKKIKEPQRIPRDIGPEYATKPLGGQPAPPPKQTASTYASTDRNKQYRDMLDEAGDLTPIKKKKKGES